MPGRDEPPQGRWRPPPPSPAPADRRRHPGRAADPARRRHHPAPVKPGETGGRCLGSDGQHVVRKGDTLDAIARRYGVSVDSLRKANNLRNHLIHPAQVLVIPDAP